MRKGRLNNEILLMLMAMNIMTPWWQMVWDVQSLLSSWMVMKKSEQWRNFSSGFNPQSLSVGFFRWFFAFLLLSFCVRDKMTPRQWNVNWQQPQYREEEGKWFWGWRLWERKMKPRRKYEGNNNWIWFSFAQSHWRVMFLLFIMMSWWLKRRWHIDDDDAARLRYQWQWKSQEWVMF